MKKFLYSLLTTAKLIKKLKMKLSSNGLFSETTYVDLPLEEV